MVYTLSLRLRELIGEMFVLRKERIAREDQLRYEAEEAVRLSLLPPLPSPRSLTRMCE